MLSNYGKFLPNLAAVLAPLYKLVQKNKWTWRKEQEVAFYETKKLLTSSNLFNHYDTDKNLVCLVTPRRMDWVFCSRTCRVIKERAVLFASCSLTPVERKYSHLEKEALSIVFGVKRFHQYLFGRPFVIVSDHRTLKYHLSEQKGIPILASAQI